MLERRLRKLEERMFPPAENAEWRTLLDESLDAERRRSARLGLPSPDEDLASVCRPGMSIGETIQACVQRLRERWALEEIGAPQ